MVTVSSESPTSRPPRGKILIVLLLLWLPACGVKTFYNNLDLLVPWYVDDYISLDDRQQAVLEKRLAEVIQWHRATQLAHYSAFMRKMGAQFKDGGVTEQGLDEVIAQLEKSWQVLIDKVAPELVDILLTATAGQKKELFENIAERNEEFKEDYLDLSREKRMRNRVKLLEKIFRRWLGPLTDRQEKIIARYSAQFLPIQQERWTFHLHWQKQLNTLLNDDSQTQAVREGLEKLFTRALDMYQPAYQHKRRVNIKLVKEMILAVDETLTQEQRRHFFDRIEYLATAFAELAEKK